MNILFIGDVFGDTGRRILSEHLDEIKSHYNIDFTIANGENCAAGRGITVNYAKKMRKYGVDAITGGNHSPAQPEVFEHETFKEIVLRPANFSGMKRGKGSTVITLPNQKKIGIINLMGKTYITAKLRCPFKEVEKILESEVFQNLDYIFVDFHAEATSEKVCMAHFLDGKVSAICGTHTHVQTNDARIFPNGTAFITDAGMTGAHFSAIGMKHEPILHKILTGEQVRFVQSKSGPVFNGVVVELDDTRIASHSIKPIYINYEFED